jgi:hypothetical protein
MPRTVSLAAMQGAMAQETDEVYLILLAVDHADMPSTLRFVNNSEDVTSNSNLYTAFPFEATMPDDKDDKEPLAELRIDNVTRTLIDEIRTIQSPPIITLSVILASSPDTIEWGPLEFETRGVTYDALSITFRLGYSAFIREPFPYIAFNTIGFPGMFQ